MPQRTYQLIPLFCLSGLVLSVVFVSLAGCSPMAPIPPSPSTPPKAGAATPKQEWAAQAPDKSAENTSKPAWRREWEETLAAAKKEGTVTVAGPPQQAEREVIMAFRQAYPDIKLEYVGMTSSEFFPRVDKERAAGIYAWDVFVGGVSTAYDYIPRDFLQPVKPMLILPEVLDDSKWLGGFDAGFTDNAGKYVYGFTAYVSNLLKVNRTSIPASELNSAEGLLDPKWKGKIVIYDPRSGGAGTLAMSALRKELGDDVMRILLVDQQPVLSTDKRQFTEWVVRGRYPIGIGVVDPYLAPFWEEGLGKDVETLETRVKVLTPGSGGLHIMNRAAHPNATKVFVNWLLSKDVQAAWAKGAATNSRRLDVPSGSPETKPDPARLESYVDFNAENGNAFMRETEEMAKRLVP